MNPPLVSVVIPVFNAERYVGDAIRSVLDQTGVDAAAIELIAVDNGSSDGSRARIQQIADARCRLLAEPQPGAAWARNRGIAESHGRFLAFLDADDRWRPGKLRSQLDALAADPALDMVFGHYASVDGNGAPLPGAPAPGYSLCTLLVRRERFDRVGPLSTAFEVGEFIDWYARAEEAGLRHAVLPDVVLERRVHGNNLTGRTGHRADYARIVALAAARRGRLGTTQR